MRFLIVDDDRVNRLVLKGFTAQHGITTEAESGYAAIVLCEAMDFDVIFMDYHMPEMNGIETVEHLRKGRNKLTRVVFVTTSDSASGFTKAFYDLKCFDWIMKPLSKRVVDDLFDRLKV